MGREGGSAGTAAAAGTARRGVRVAHRTDFLSQAEPEVDDGSEHEDRGEDDVEHGKMQLIVDGE